MTDFLGFFAYLALPLIGIGVWRFDAVRRLSLDGRLALAGAAGALMVALTMSLMSIAGVQWSRTRLVIAFAALACAGAASRRIWIREGRTNWRSPALAGIVIVLAVTAYALLTARETCGDLLFFWGPKGVHFFRAGKIDLQYLADINNFLAHRDYPPLLPLLYAWSHTVSRSFSWWAAVLFAGVCLTGIVAIVRAGTQSDLAGLLTAAALASAFGSAFVAGGADPLLLFFEATAVGGLLFIEDSRAQWIVTAIGVAGAALTKVEGASFAAAVLIAVLLLKSRPLVLTAAVLLATVPLAAWLFVMTRHNLLDGYRGSGPIHLEYFWRVLKATVRMADYHAYWIPWIAPLIVIVVGNVRRARLPLTIAALTFVATIYFYLHGPHDPTSFWIRSSAPRVLLTPLLMTLMAAGAALNARSSAPAPATAPASHRSD
ncbi:MAG: hypothetical protein AABO58_11260 [Acidobacteriota bacterium]